MKKKFIIALSIIATLVAGAVTGCATYESSSKNDTISTVSTIDESSELDDTSSEDESSESDDTSSDESSNESSEIDSSEDESSKETKKTPKKETDDSSKVTTTKTTTKAVETTTQQTTTSKPAVTTKVTANKPATTTTTKKAVTSVNDQTCNHVWCSDAEAAIYTIDGITYKTVVCVKCQMTHTEVVKNTSKTTTKTTTTSKTIPTNAWIPVYFKTVVANCVADGYDWKTNKHLTWISPTYWDVKALSRGEAKAQANYKKANDEASEWCDPDNVKNGGWVQGGNDHPINTPDKSSIAFWYYRDSNGKLAIQFPISPNQLYSGIKTEADLKTYGCYDNVSSIGKTGLEYANVYYTGTPWA